MATAPSPAVLAAFRAALSALTKKRLSALESVQTCKQLDSCLWTVAATSLAAELRLAGGEPALLALLQKYKEKPYVCIAVMHTLGQVLHLVKPGRTPSTWPAAEVQHAADSICSAAHVHMAAVDVLEPAFLVLRMIAYNLPSIEKVVAAGTLRLHAAALQRHAHVPAAYRFRRDALEMISHLLVVKESMTDDWSAVVEFGSAALHAAAEQLLASEAVETIISLVNMHPTEWEVTKNAIKALERLACVGGANKRLLLAGAAVAIVAGVKRHAERRDVVEWALTALLYLAADPNGMLAVAEAGAADVLRLALETHAICSAACLLIGRLVAAPGPAALMLEARVHEKLVELLLKHGTTPLVARASCCALSRWAERASGARSDLVAVGAMEGLLRTLKAFSLDPGVLGWAAVALKHFLVQTPPSASGSAADAEAAKKCFSTDAAATARARLPLEATRDALGTALRRNAAETDTVLSVCQALVLLCEDKLWLEHFRVPQVALAAADATVRQLGDGSSAVSPAADAACVLLTDLVTGEDVTVARWGDALPAILRALVRVLERYSACGDAEVATRVLRLLAVCANDDSAAQLLVDAGVAAATVAALRAFADQHVVFIACYLLKSVTAAELKGSQQATLRAGAVPVLLRTLHNSDYAANRDTAINAVRVLSLIIRSDCGVSGIDMALLAAIRRHEEDAELVSSALDALRAVWDHPRAATVCHPAPSLLAVDGVVRKHEARMDLLVDAGNAVASIALARRGAELAPDEAGAAVQAAHALATAILKQPGDDTAAEPVFEALLHLARHWPQARALIVASADGAVVDALRTGLTIRLAAGTSTVDSSAQKVMELAFQALGHLALSSDGWAAAQRRCTLEAAVAAVADARATERVVVAACELLSNFSLSDTVCELVLSPPSLEAVTGALLKYKDSASVAAAGCMTLRNWAAAAACRPRLMASSAVSLIVAALKTHAVSARVAAPACAALRNLAATAVFRHALMLAGAGETVIAVIARGKLDGESAKLHSESVWAASGALFALACEPANMPALVAAGAVTATVAALQRQVADARTAWSASGIAVKLLGGVSDAQRKEVLTAESTAAACEALTAMLSLHSGDARVAAAASAALKLLSA